MSEFRILLSPFRGLAAMLCILLWLLCGMGILCVMVFCRKRKGALPVVDREVMISESVSNIAAVTLLLTQLLFPVYGYLMNPLAGSYPGRMDPVGEVLARLLTTHNIHCFEPFNWYGDNSVYMYVILTAVFCFFAGMFVYKNGLKIKHKVFLFLPLFVLIVTLILSFIRIVNRQSLLKDFPEYYFLYIVDCIERYLSTAFMMIAVLYGIYVLLKKLTRNEIIPLIVILILSFFAPCVYVVNDGLKSYEPVIKYLYFGPDIPLFPIGMIVMKYKDKLLPKTKKGTLIYLFSWLFAGGLAFWFMFEIQYILAERAGVYLSDAHSCFADKYAESMKYLRPIYKTACVPWLIIGLALSMIILSLSLLIRTGNPVTKFIREHIYLITVMLFSRHVFFEISGHNRKFWTDLLKLPDNLFIIVPILYFALAVVLAYLIKRFVLDRRK